MNVVTDKTSLSGWLNGLLGVVIFSGSLPATRLAVQDFDPFFLTFVRASLAGVLALILILGLREKRPPAARIVPLMMVSLGVVIGFPLFTALALQHVTAAHSIVFLGLLPLMTAISRCCAARNVLPGLFGSSRSWAACWWRGSLFRKMPLFP